MWKLFRAGIVGLLIVSGCGSNDTPTRRNDFTPLTSIEIVAPPAAIARLTSTPLVAIGNFSGLFSREITSEVVWSSSAPAVADFVHPGYPGRVSGLEAGSAELTASLQGVTASHTLTVSAATVTALNLTPDSPTIPRGLDCQFGLQGTFSDATTQDLTFDANWTSSDPAVATIDDDSDDRGLAESVAVGTTTITATFAESSATTVLTVTVAQLESIEVTPANPSVLGLSSGRFTAIGHYTDETSADITEQVIWESSNTAVASIASTGTFKTDAPGTASIIATLNGVSAGTRLKVTGGVLTGITLTPENPVLVKETLGRLTAIGTFSNGSLTTTRDITGLVEWTVSAPGLAEVVTPGGNLALLHALGTTPPLATVTIQANVGSITATTQLAITAPLLQGLTLLPVGLNLPVGASDRFKLTGNFSDGTFQDLTLDADWTSNDAGIAKPGNNGWLDKGRIVGLSPGNTIVTALAGGLRVTAPVTVVTGGVQDLILSNPPANLVSGTTAQFTLTAYYPNGVTLDVTEDASWSIANTNVVILSDPYHPGQVVAVDSGTTTVTAEFGGLTRNVTLTVP